MYMYVQVGYSTYMSPTVAREASNSAGHVLAIRFFSNFPAKNLRAVHIEGKADDTYRP